MRALKFSALFDDAILYSVAGRLLWSLIYYVRQKRSYYIKNIGL